VETIPQTDAASAPSKTQDLLNAVKKQTGGLPNILATMAQSPAGRSSYLGVAGALAARSLSNVNRKQIALAVAGANVCDYCASVHTGRGKGAGLSSDEMARNLIGRSSYPKTAALSGVACEVVRLRGQTTAAQLATLTTPVSIMRPVSRLSRTSHSAFSRTTSTISRGPKMISR
jgi:AhpD family alkylhydroperoxidase